MLPDCYLDHIAIATDDLESTVDLYSKLGLSFEAKREIVEDQKVKTAFAAIDENAHVELLEPTSSDSAIHKFIEKKGPGIHHLCFRVPDVMAKQKELEAQGMRFIYSEPVKGANNCLVNFIHPKSMKGVLTEISQKL
ncbi:MAG: methylmalonyl-CoA epimerase [Halobacteriovoraceae bacterium]|nr:methylmalonyl-CoA epimerase [Halobacteriovoraceae bacterium]|tara:strand:+ start:13022 stop:13432 length:411 start_codon:yes stop_codon:yes gene_type:complete